MKKYNQFFLSVLILMLSITTSVHAQQDPQFTQYMYNTLAVNPAYAGSRGAMAASLLHRQQWIGLEGAPMSQTFILHTPLKWEKMGLGFSVVHDQIGPTRLNSVAVDYSYTVKLSTSVKLAFGIKAGADMMRQFFNDLVPFQNQDPSLLSTGNQVSFVPNAGAGLYLHHERWYLGASCPRLLEGIYDFDLQSDLSSNVRQVRHWSFIGGLIIPVHPDVKLKPTVLCKIARNVPYAVDATLEALYRERISLGAGLRLGDSFYGMFNCLVTEQLRIGLAYDYSTTKLRNVNDGTVELMIGYDFNYNRKSLKSPRYF
jgi:type IX secretion system PorP/SprF family membrane protein